MRWNNSAFSCQDPECIMLQITAVFMSFAPTQFLKRVQLRWEKQQWHNLTSLTDFLKRKYKFLRIQNKLDSLRRIYLQYSYPRCISLHLNRSCGLSGSLLGISPVLNRVHQSSQLSSVSAPPGFPPGKANGPCAAYTSPNYKDAQRVAFVPNKPPLLNYLNVPLWSCSGPAHMCAHPALIGRERWKWRRDWTLAVGVDFGYTARYARHSGRARSEL